MTVALRHSLAKHRIVEALFDHAMSGQLVEELLITQSFARELSLFRRRPLATQITLETCRVAFALDRGLCQGGGVEFLKQIGPAERLLRQFTGFNRTELAPDIEIDSAIEIGLYRVRHVHLGVPSFFEHIVPEF